MTFGKALNYGDQFTCKQEKGITIMNMHILLSADKIYFKSLHLTSTNKKRILRVRIDICDSRRKSILLKQTLLDIINY